MIVSHTPQLCTWNCSHSSMAVNPHTCSHLRPAPLDHHLLACLCFIHQLMRLTQAERAGGLKKKITKQKKPTVSHQSNVRYVTTKHYEAADVLFDWTFTLFFFTSPCNLTQPVQHVSMMNFLLGEEFRRDEDVSFSSIAFTVKSNRCCVIFCSCVSFITSRICMYCSPVCCRLFARKIWEQVHWGGPGVKAVGAVSASEEKFWTKYESFHHNFRACVSAYHLPWNIVSYSTPTLLSLKRMIQ